MKIKYLLTDLDGVIRKYPKERDSAIERKFGLTEGSIFLAAFKCIYLEDAVCGRISDESWRKEIENKLILNFDVDAVKAALSEWSDFSGILDREYLRFLEFNFPDIPVAILTNGTTRLRKDLANLKFDTQIYKIFNSAEIGVCKPNDEIYMHVTENLRASPSEILFIDDSIDHVNAAKVLGFQVHHYTTLEAFIDKFKTEAVSKKL